MSNCMMHYEKPKKTKLTKYNLGDFSTKMEYEEIVGKYALAIYLSNRNDRGDMLVL